MTVICPPFVVMEATLGLEFDDKYTAALFCEVIVADWPSPTVTLLWLRTGEPLVVLDGQSCVPDCWLFTMT